MINSLTSLRFVFAFLVFLSHLQFTFLRSGRFRIIYEQYFHELGKIGVAFFFILSGFILAHRYQEEIFLKKLNFKKFMADRLARIYPVHLFTFILSLPLLMVLDNVKWQDILVKIVCQLLLIQSYAPDSETYFSFNSPSWSISDEMTFYALFPLLILIFLKSRVVFISVFLAFVCSVILLMTKTDIDTRYTFFIAPYIRILDFILGILVYNIYLHTRQRLSNYYLITLLQLCSVFLLTGFYFTHQNVVPACRYSLYYWLPMLLVILTFAYSNGLISKILSAEFLVKLGEISFSFYLLHLLIIRYTIILFIEKAGFDWSNWILFFVIVSIATISSFICYNFIEKPANKKIKLFLSQRMFHI